MFDSSQDVDALPDKYDSTRVYNCFLESLDGAEFRQVVYIELLMRKAITTGHVLDDGRIQLYITNFHAAIEAHNAAIDDINRSLDVERASAWNEKGEALLDSGKYDQALSAFTEALKLVPQHPLS